MRRSFFLAGLILVSAVPHASAQFAAIGPKVGVNSSTISAKDDHALSHKIGLVAGGFVRFEISSSVTLQPEVSWVQRGNDADEGANQILKFDIDYIEVPVLLRLSLSSASGVRPFVYAGPYVAFKQACSVSGHDATGNVDIDCADLGDIFVLKSTDFGGAAGAGLDFRLGAGSLFVDARFTQGIENIAEKDPSGSSARNRTLSLTTGFAFALAGR